MIKVEVSERTLHFRQPARTSRGEYTLHRMFLVTLSDGRRTGIGECAPLPDLSCDRDAYGSVEIVQSLVRDAVGTSDDIDEIKRRAAGSLRDFPALLFAVESALCELTGELYDTPFARGEVGIPINGLVWMGNYDEMLSRMEEKIADGYRCIKLKIGAIGWSEEIRLLKILRSRFSSDELQLRVDANGAFSHEEAEFKLNELAQYGIHSIEQPVKAGQWELTAHLVRVSPIPVALDEELIGVNMPEEKRRLLETVRPQYVVVKPTLHGGLSGAREWIETAASLGIGSWITSALESNIGLKSIALLCASVYGVTEVTAQSLMPQGLGTGLLYTDNIDTGVEIRNGYLTLHNA